MKYVLCLPCGTVCEGKTEEEAVRVTQAHAKKEHDYVPPREEILKAMLDDVPTQG